MVLVVEPDKPDMPDVQSDHPLGCTDYPDKTIAITAGGGGVQIIVTMG